MSTILKALKQVDQTAPPEDIQSWPPQVDTKGAVKARVEKIRLNRKIYLSIVLALIILAAGWLVYSQKDILLAKLSSSTTPKNDTLRPPASSANGPVYRAKVYPPASKQTIRSPKKDSAAIRREQQAALASEPKPTRPDKPSRQVTQNPLQKDIAKNQDITLSRKPGLPPKTAPSKSQISRSQLADPDTPVRTQGQVAATSPAREAKSPTKQVSRSYQRLDDSKLKLQAIAWSADATQRIAVINNHVVREGESVEGFSINQIRPDDIIVNDGTEFWRLEFGLK